MEPIGLAVGVAGLAGLISTCLDVIERVDAYQHFGTESRALTAVFEADKLLFKKWVRGVGIRDGRLTDDHHPVLDEPETLAVVKRLYASLHELAALDGSANEGIESPRGVSAEPIEEKSANRRNKLSWALKGKRRFVTLAQNFGTLVEKLQTLVPVGANIPVTGLNGESDEALEKSAWFSESREVLAELKQQTEYTLRKELDSWLNASRTNILYDDFARRRVPGTCDWVLDHPSFVDWASAESKQANLLWINGPPGYGKTILCARILEHLSISLDNLVAYHFVSAESDSRARPFDIVRSWVSQVVSTNQEAFDLACARWDAVIGQKASTTDIVNLFKDITEAIPGLVFIVDGLDECAWTRDGHQTSGNETVGVVLHSIKRAIEGTTTRVLIVSRDELDIRSAFDETWEGCPAACELTLSTEHVQSDAEVFSRTVVERKLANKPEDLRADLSQKIAERCDGMFLWVKMLEDKLRGGKNRKQLESIVDETPTALDQVYDRNWTSILGLADSDRNRALAILRWASCSSRPLTIAELTVALLLRDDDVFDDIPVDDLPDDIDKEYVRTEILGLCSSLIEVRLGESTTDYGSATIQLVHFSAKQYVIRKLPLPEVLGANGDLVQSIERTVKEQHYHIARLCLRYVNSSSTWQEPHDSSMKHAFRDYASRSWPAHIFAHDLDHKSALLVNTLFRPNNANWGLWRRYHEGIWVAPDATPLYLASMMGLRGTVEYLLCDRCELGVDINYVDKAGRTALLGAFIGKHVEVAKVLLENGADINITKGAGGDLLSHLGAMMGDMAWVTMAVQHGVDVNAHDDEGWTALICAVDSGKAEMVRFLLENGADVGGRGPRGWSALQSAARDGKVEIARLLLKNDNCMWANDSQWWPLHGACYHNQIEMAKLLIEEGADINALDCDEWTPLHAAARQGHVEVVKLLLDKGAEFLPTTKGSAPLHLAAMYGKTETAALLLEHGSELKENGYGMTPFQLAAKNGHLDLVKVFLKQMPDLVVNPGTTQRSMVWLAARGGHCTTIQFLLDTGKFVADDKDWHGAIPLFAAVRNGHDDAAVLLCKYSYAPTDLSDGFGHSLIWWAKRTGLAETTVERLVELGQETGVPPSEDDVAWAGEPSKVVFDPKTRWCDVCTRCFPPLTKYFRCNVCHGGDFDICVECADKGAKCRDASHEWTTGSNEP